ncbi:UBX domain protein Ubx2 [Basidiobolus ranarum]|uniref:UBX domain protein Ubx2 n=1 Tax=Basidiobolus ranarum TaxID=34480 RepID=A0ABR2VVG7_9FUNG
MTSKDDFLLELVSLLDLLFFLSVNMGDFFDPELIANFCQITNATPEVANNYLTVSEGNVEQAITLYLESGGADLSGVHSTTQPREELSNQNYTESDAEMAQRLAAQDTVRAPIASRMDTLIGDSPGYGEETYSPVYRANRRGPPQSIFNQLESIDTRPREAFRDFAAEAATIRGSASSDHTSRLADLFRPPFDIMSNQDFEQTRNTAKSQGKWLMVNIQEVSEFVCQILNRDLWSDKTVQDIIKENFLFLQFSSDSVEGKKYLTFYPIENYPHIAIIDPRTGERMKVWNAPVTPIEFLMNVTEFLDCNTLLPAIAPVTKKPRNKNIEDLSEEEQLNIALAASMNAASTSSAPKSPEQIEIIDSEPESDDNVSTSVIDSIKPVERSEPANGSDTTRIQFRLPDGSRIIRRFMKTDPVRHLFEFIKASVPDLASEPIELVYLRQQLIDKIDGTLEENGLLNAAVSVSVP